MAITSYQLERPQQLTESSLPQHLDYYKATMSQLVYENEPSALVTFSLHNRANTDLRPYVHASALESRLYDLAERGWSKEIINYLGGLSLSSGESVFSNDYLEYLENLQLPIVQIADKQDLKVEVTGEWPAATYWETAVLSEINELYFENYLRAKGLDPEQVYDEGDRRLSEKIEILRAHPDIKFADFGTRRHFSAKWQEHVLARLVSECPENIIGTSNIALAQKFDIKPIGTFAHELPMVYAGLAQARGQDLRASHHHLLNDWYCRYGRDYSIALTDTFGSDFFFSDFTPEQAMAWKGVRHDSGDPCRFADQVIEFYRSLGINPLDKTIVFSDGLDIDKIVALQERYGNQINTVFGWGTDLTNDLGVKALNIVMKATAVNGVSTVKLSDEVGKHTGAQHQIKLYQEVFG